ncbi:cysteine hydrolase family protein [Fundicoccus sp. Sow4_D5]|uniref:cysteine hydrolase family protein n=1 Tax=Fundicoccus sp. Sow4_D5 TaxID=3438782 RepID=UPI003F91C093
MYAYIHETVVQNNERLLKFAREHDMLVIHAIIESSFDDGRERSMSHRRPEFNNIVIAPVTYESKIVTPLTPQKNEVVIKKTSHSAVDSSLVLLLNNLGINDVITTGLVTDQCVSSTVRGLSDHNFRVWTVEDTTMAGTFELRDNELTILNNTYCNVVNTEEILNVL